MLTSAEICAYQIKDFFYISHQNKYVSCTYIIYVFVLIYFHEGYFKRKQEALGCRAELPVKSSQLDYFMSWCHKHKKWRCRCPAVYQYIKLLCHKNARTVKKMPAFVLLWLKRCHRCISLDAYLLESGGEGSSVRILSLKRQNEICIHPNLLHPSRPLPSDISWRKKRLVSSFNTIIVHHCSSLLILIFSRWSWCIFK